MQVQQCFKFGYEFNRVSCEKKVDFYCYPYLCSPYAELE